MAPAGPWSNIVFNNGAEDGFCDIAVQPPAPYTFVHSSDIGAFGVPHPVVVWGNGTALKIPNFLNIVDATCYYRPVLEHLASWGFVVVAPNDGYVGSGQELLDAVDELTALSDDPESPFFDKVDLSNISAVGHSQGAQGAIHAAVAPNSPFTSVLSMSTPDPVFGNDPRWDEALRLLGMEYDRGPRDLRDSVAQLSVPVFFVRGEYDCDESAWMRALFSGYLLTIGALELAAFVSGVPCISSNESDQAYFELAAGPAAKGTVDAGAGHIDLSEAIGYSHRLAWLHP